MTDARLPDRWLADRRILRLPDHAFRLYTLALMWSVSNRTDGRLDDEDIDLIPCPATEGSRAVLVKAGLWQAESTGYRIVDFQTTQTSAAALAASEQKAAHERERKARQRSSVRSVRDSPQDSPAERRAPTQDRTETGEARSRTRSERSSTDHYSGSDADSLYPSSGISDDDWDSEWADEAS